MPCPRICQYLYIEKVRREGFEPSTARYPLLGTSVLPIRVCSNDWHSPRLSYLRPLDSSESRFISFLLSVGNIDLSPRVLS